MYARNVRDTLGWRIPEMMKEAFFLTRLETIELVVCPLGR